MKRIIACSMLVSIPLFLFADYSEQVNDLTWYYHRKGNGAYSHWAVIDGVQGRFWLPGMEEPITTPIGDIRIPFQLSDPYELGNKIKVKEIGYAAFRSCERITGVVMNSYETKIGDYAFADCTNLTSVATSYGTDCVDLHSGVTEVGSFAFSGCTKLANVIISGAATSIGESAFRGCKNLQRVTIGSHVTSIGELAFANCDNINSLFVEDGNVSFKVDSGMLLSKDGKMLISGVIAHGNVAIPENVSEINGKAFAFCGRLTSVTIPSSVTSIGTSAFYQCGNLNDVIFKGDAPSVDQSCFAGVKSSCCVYVEENSSGWGVSIPGTWNGIQIAYIPAMRTIVFNANGGFLDESFSIKKIRSGNAVGVLPVPSREGYTFAGWRTAENGGEQISETTKVSSDATYYAHWVNTPILIVADGVLKGVADWCGCTSLIIPDSVISIGSSAFKDCTSLTSVTIPDSVTSIGYSAFDGCISLTDLAIPDSVTDIGDYAFYGCRSLSSVLIPNGVNNIGEYTFNGCDSLMRVTIPNSVTSVGSCAFQNCTSLTNVTIPDSVTSIGGGAFGGCNSLTDVAVSDSVTSIGGGAFYGTPFLGKQPYGLVVLGRVVYKMRENGAAEVSVPDGVVSVSEYAFEGCSSLTSVVLPNSLSCIGYRAFYGCRKLSNIVVGENLASIGSGAFAGTQFYNNLPNGLVVLGRVAYCVKGACPSVIYIPSGVTHIAQEAFLGCGELSRISLEGGTVSIGDKAFYGCTGLKSVVIPDSVTDIGDYAFYGCTSLSSVAMGRGVVHIGLNAFSQTPFYLNQQDGLVILGGVAYEMRGSCPESVVIPSNVKRIEDYAFIGCGRLKEVSIPNSVTSIGNYAFYGCNNLISITVAVSDKGSVSIPIEWMKGTSGRTIIDVAANGRKMWECYLFGLNPEAADDDFKITSFPMKADGSPDLEAITFSPPQSKWNISGATPKLKGKAKLSDQWQDVPPDGNPSFRFFTIAVELP